MRIVDRVVVHGTVVHATFPFGGLQLPPPADGSRRASVAAPLEQAVTIAITPGLPIPAIGEPPLVPLLQAGIGPFQQIAVLTPLVDLPNHVRAHRRLRAVGTDSF